MARTIFAGGKQTAEERRLARENHDATVSRLGDTLLALQEIETHDESRTCRELAELCARLVLVNSQLLDRVAVLEGMAPHAPALSFLSFTTPADRNGDV